MSVQCKMWNGDFGVLSVKCGVGCVDYKVWGGLVKCDCKVRGLEFKI